MAEWASIADIAAATGATVSALVRTQAAQAIELHTGLIEAVVREDISDRDLYWLKLAVCYQAAWIEAQPDYLERTAVTQASQDGQSAMYGPDALTLSPLARRALKKLSWRGPRAIVPDRGTTVPRLDPVSDASDDYMAWQPMGGTS